MEKIKTGYYRSLEVGPSEVSMVARLFPEAILWGGTALFYYGYSDRTPMEWEVIVSKNVSPSRFEINYPYIKPFFVRTEELSFGVTTMEIEGVSMNILDRDRLICESLKNEADMDRETFNKAIQAYLEDPKKNIRNLIDYAERRRVTKRVHDVLGGCGYEGHWCFRLVGRIKNTQNPFNVDSGIGDVAIPRAEKRRIPTQLGDFEAPEIGTYSLESTIAEKFDAILEQMELTSRVKDYYDLHFIATTFDFDGWVLQEAIMETLQNRGAVYDASRFARILSFSSNTDMTVSEMEELNGSLVLFYGPIIHISELLWRNLGKWNHVKRNYEQLKKT